jgi:hypothetical protein
MKSFLAIPALFALGAVADSASGWGFTWTFTSGHSTWTSATAAATSPATWTTTEAAATSTATASEWGYTTDYTATYSSGTSTWVVPTVVSYSEAQNYTSMIPAPPKSTVMSSLTVKATTSVAAASSTTAAPASTFTGAAVHEKVVGMGALAVAGLAFVL